MPGTAMMRLPVVHHVLIIMSRLQCLLRLFCTYIRILTFGGTAAPIAEELPMVV